MVWPVMYDDAGIARKTMAPAICVRVSSGFRVKVAGADLEV